MTGSRPRREGATVARLAPLVERVALPLLAVMAMLSVGRAISNNLTADWGGWDFHSYWYNAHFLREGRDPYAAFAAGLAPALPVRYLDGSTDAEAPLGDERLGRTPANTAPMLLVTAPLAWLSWPVARDVWLVLNLALALCVPLLAVRALPRPDGLPTRRIAMVVLSFLAFQGTRVAIGGGQTTLIVFALMLAALLIMDRRPSVAGLLLGVALSKYSLILPVCGFLVYDRRVRVVMVALVVQIAALLGVAALGDGSPMATLGAYRLIAEGHVEQPGVHLANMFPNDPRSNLIAVVVVSAAVLGALALWMIAYGRPRARGEPRRFAGYHILTALMLWGLLVIYHRNYDSLLAVLFVAGAVYGLTHPDLWRMGDSERAGVATVVFGAVLVLSAPGEVMASVLSGDSVRVWLEMGSRAITMTVVFLAGMTLWMLFRVPVHLPGSGTGRGATRREPPDGAVSP